MELHELKEFLIANRSWIIAPFLTMNATLSVLESIQRFISFDREEVVGQILELNIQPVRSIKPLRLSSFQLRFTALDRNKQVSSTASTLHKYLM